MRLAPPAILAVLLVACSCSEPGEARRDLPFPSRSAGAVPAKGDGPGSAHAGAEVLVGAPPAPVARPEPAPEPGPAWRPRDGDPTEAPHPIEDPSGRALDAFYAALARADDGEPGAIARVTHMGDSSIGMDQLPHYLRRKFQDRFGDAGPGFVLLQPHSTSYRNQTVHLDTPTPWEFCFIIFRCLPDGRYGLGGVAAKSRGGATTVIRPVDGRTVSRVELWYAGLPRGGRLELRVDRDEPVLLDTDAEALEARWHELRVEPGRRSVRVRAAGRGPVRAYGVVLENDGPGVVWDTLSMIGAFTPRLLEQDPEHFAQQLAHRESDLVVLGFGGNDLRRYAGRGVAAAELQAETRELLSRVKGARPDIACLLTGIVEHEMSGRTRITARDVEAVVDAQRAAAREAGCAFFDVYRAMGGAGSYARWRARGLAADDGKHLSPAGRRELAEWMYAGLASGYVAYRARGARPD